MQAAAGSQRPQSRALTTLPVALEWARAATAAFCLSKMVGQGGPGRSAHVCQRTPRARNVHNPHVSARAQLRHVGWLFPLDAASSKMLRARGLGSLAQRGWPCACTCVVAAPSRTYFIGRPVPTVSKEDLVTMAKTGHDALGPRLLQYEFNALSDTKQRGYVAATNATGQSFFNTYYKYCWGSKRPYIAMDKHGSSVYVDATPVLTFAREAKLDALAAVLQALGATVASASLHRPADAQLQVVRAESVRKQSSLTMPGPFEGSNAQKVADTRGGEVFTVYTGSRAQARRVAEAFYLAYCAAFSVPTPTQTAAVREEKAVAKKEAYRRLMLRKLRALVADDVAVRQLRVAAGVVDGFIAKDKAGLVR